MYSCECCGEHGDHPFVFVRDHNQVTGKQRGRVCRPCNQYIGNMEWAQIRDLQYRMMLSYLDRFDPILTLSRNTKPPAA